MGPEPVSAKLDKVLESGPLALIPMRFAKIARVPCPVSLFSAAAVPELIIINPNAGCPAQDTSPQLLSGTEEFRLEAEFLRSAGSPQDCGPGRGWVGLLA